MRKIIFYLLVTFITQFLLAQKTYIWCGTLIDGISNEPKKNMTIVIEKNKIVAVENGFSKAVANDKTIDLKTKTVTPG
jgi:imidazolonepropionase-like amidohydrolase